MISPLRIKPSIRLIVAASFLVVLAAAFFIFKTRSLSVASVARVIVQECSKVSGDHSACYESEVPNLYPKLPIPEIFDVVRAIRAEDRSYQFCHVLGHKLGGRVVAEDPSKWMNFLSFNPTDGLCSNGFIHGVIGGRFRADVLDDATIEKFIPDFKIACEPRSDWKPTTLDQAMCYHGLGHLYDFITNANIPKAISLCDRTSVSPTGDFLRVCHEGVFMQIYQPLEPDDYALIAQMPVKPTKDTVRSFCASFKKPDTVGACLRESWPFFYDGIVSGTGVAAFCSGQPDETQTYDCYQSASSILGRMTLDDPKKAAAGCMAYPAQWQSLCFIDVSQAVVEEDRTNGQPAIDLCNMAPGDISQQCLVELANRAQFDFGYGSSEYKNFCALLPPSVQAKCANPTSFSVPSEDDIVTR